MLPRARVFVSVSARHPGNMCARHPRSAFKTLRPVSVGHDMGPRQVHRRHPRTLSTNIEVEDVPQDQVDSPTWPDGTPKKFQGAEAWKNWINWDAPYHEVTDEMNRKRHFFFRVDRKGGVWRREWDQEGTFGQIKDARFLNYFFQHMQNNCTGEYEEDYPFLSRRMHEQYFVQCDSAPLVFNDLRDGELQFMCPDCKLAPSLTTTFQPELLRLSEHGELFHPVSVVIDRAKPPVGIDRGQPAGSDASNRSNQRPPRTSSTVQEASKLLALIESSTAQELLMNVSESQQSSSGFQITVDSDVFPLQSF